MCWPVCYPRSPVIFEVTDALAGQLVSIFALTAALAAPILGTATSGWERRRTIGLSLGVFVVGNVITALAPTYPVALGGRVVAALGASLLNAAISGYVIHLVPERHRGKALSFVLGGWMTATALGVPVGLVLGQSSWRFPLIMVAIVGTVALIGILIKLPHLDLPPTTLAQRLRPLRQVRLVSGLLVTTGILCASYTCFTFAVLILGPTHPAGWMIILIMFGYGLASLIGNTFTGRLADRFGAVRVLTIILIGLLLNAVFGAVTFAFAPLGRGGGARIDLVLRRRRRQRWCRRAAAGSPGRHGTGLRGDRDGPERQRDLPRLRPRRRSRRHRPDHRLPARRPLDRRRHRADPDVDLAHRGREGHQQGDRIAADHDRLIVLAPRSPLC